MSVLIGDCREVMAGMEPESVDAVCTDPPYELSFMSKSWDGTGIANDVGMWREAYRVLKPGGHLVAFGGARTSHRMVCAIEDAGFEIRDSFCYMYGVGFPKSSRVNRDPRFCQCGESGRNGANSNREPQQEGHSDTVAASLCDAPQLSNAPHSTGIPSGSRDDCQPACDCDGGHVHPEATGDQASVQRRGYALARIRSDERADDQDDESSRSPSPAQRIGHPSSQGSLDLAQSVNDADADTQASRSVSGSAATRTDTATPLDHTPHTTSLASTSGPPAPKYNSGFPSCSMCGKPIADGLGTALKPAHEPICLARKPLIGTVAANVLAHGTGALNIDGCRIGTTKRVPGSVSLHPRGTTHADEWGYAVQDPTTCGGHNPNLGRWPANVILSHAPDCVEVGARRVRGSNGVRGSDSGNTMYGSGRGLSRPATGQEVGYADADGMETVTAWECAPGCAVAALDAQSGERGKSSGVQRMSRATGIYGSNIQRGDPKRDGEQIGYGDTGGASRFFLNVAPIDADGETVQAPTGRWPANTILSHAPDCREVGTRRVKGAGWRDTDKRTTMLRGNVAPDAANGTHYADADGMETVTAWECAPGCAVAELDRQSGESANGRRNRVVGSPTRQSDITYGGGLGTTIGPTYPDAGGASRYFLNAPIDAEDWDGVRFRYQSKASRVERSAGLPDGQRSDHPCVKPVALMSWLARLVCPPGGLILDPFAGSGSTGVACVREGFRFVGIEQDESYASIAEARIAHAEAVRDCSAPVPLPDLPLFARAAD